MTERQHLQAWLRNIPEHWDAPLLKLVTRVESGHTPSRQHPEYWIPEECTIPWFSLADIWQLREGKQKYLGETSEKISPRGIANSGARLLPAGTVVLSRTASVGFSGVMPVPMATTQDFVNFVPGPRLTSDYLLWVLRGMKSEFDRLKQGSTHKTIYMPDLLQFRTPLPSLTTQRAIADFLDRRTAALDALIEKKARLVEVLAERRAALIHRAVTRGLDPDVPLKDSGVEWIGRIPAHWAVKRLKFLLDGIEQGWSPECEQRLADEDEWGVLKAGAVNHGVFREEEHKALPARLAPRVRYAIRPGDVLMSRASGSPECVGSVSRVPEIGRRLLLCDKLYRLSFAPGTDPDFLVLVLGGPGVRSAINESSTGQSTLKNIGQDFVKSIPVPLPPASEQHAIATELRETIERQAAMADAAGKQIDRLQEYRQALITAAVTGQLDIPEAAA